MHPLLVINQIKGGDQSPQGFTLPEVIAVFMITAIIAVIALPNLSGIKKEAQAKEAYLQIKNALTQARINADRLSKTCTLNFNNTGSNYLVSASPNGCVLETFTIDTNVVSLTKTNFSKNPKDISFSITGKTGNASTLWITRKDIQDQPLENVARCIVISSTGMIRTGFNQNGVCNNVQNQKYDDLL